MAQVRFIQTFTGKQFHLLNPRPEDICIEDIAHALSMLCRFTGHTRVFYSVAEHSMHCSLVVPKEHRLQALLHDATEAYLGDLSAPLKSLNLLNGYSLIEADIWRVIARAFQIPHVIHPKVKDADRYLLGREAKFFWTDEQTKDWEVPIPSKRHPLQLLSPANAEVGFLQMFKVYSGD